MSRVSKVDLEDWDPGLRTLAAADSATDLERGPMRIMAHKPETSKGFVHFYASMKGEWTLPARMMELMRLRIAFHNQCRSCMAIRYREAVDDGVDEGLVCSLEKPMEAEGLSDRERLAIDYGERLASNHLSIDDAYYDRLREQFSEDEIVELGIYAAVCVGFGRLAASWDMIEDLPAAYQARDTGPIAPWKAEAHVVVR